MAAVPSFPTLRRLIAGAGALTLALWALSALAAPAGPTPVLPDPARIDALVREGRRAEALPLCRTYAAARPDDAVMLYNLACLENTVGDPGAAATAYAGALAAGFDRWAVAEADPDLQGALHARVVALNAGERDRLERIAAARSLTLERDVTSADLPLTPHGAAAGAAADASGAAVLRLDWNAGGLAFELEAAGPWQALFTGPGRAPWLGGPGLFVSLGVPDGADPLAVPAGPLFAFGLEDKGGVGALHLPGQGHWQRVTELAPKVRVAEDGTVRITASIPWTALAPYGPITDSPLGLNATLVRPGPEGPLLASLLPTIDTRIPGAATRRQVAVAFDAASIPEDVLVGRVGSTLSTDRPLDVDLVAVSTEAGPGRLRLDFQDLAGRSLLPQGPVETEVDLAAGPNPLQRQADFTGLKNGGYLVDATLVFPSGREATWRTPVLQLAPGWDLVYRDRISYLPAGEQATVAYTLDAVEQAVAAHRGRDNPGAIVTTLLDLEQMLADAEETGSILPAEGGAVFVYPGPGGEDRLCRLYLPAGREYADAVNPVLVLTHGLGREARLAERIGRNYEFGDRKPTLKIGDDRRFPVYLVPELEPDREGDREALAREVAACRAWAAEAFAAPAVSLVGIDALGGTVLQAARDDATGLNGVLVFAGQELDPWPGATAEFLAGQFAPAPADLPVAWIDFVSETRRAGQAADVLAALRATGWEVAVQEVRGGLNLSQAADRVVLWAEELR